VGIKKISYVLLPLLSCVLIKNVYVASALASVFWSHLTLWRSHSPTTGRADC